MKVTVSNQPTNNHFFIFFMISYMDMRTYDDNNEVEQENYVPPPQKTIEELVAADKNDESLRSYKEALLGNAQLGKIIYGNHINFFIANNNLIFDNYLFIFCNTL